MNALGKFTLWLAYLGLCFVVAKPALPFILYTVGALAVLGVLWKYISARV